MLKPEMQPAAVPPQAAAPRSALRERLLDPRTLISFAILAVVLFVVLTHVQLDYGESLRAIGQTNLLLYALAFAAFYFSFVVRTACWDSRPRSPVRRAWARSSASARSTSWC